MATFVFLIVTIVLIGAALFCELRRDLMILQQNSYRNERYQRWLRTSGDTTSVMRLMAIIIFFIGLANLKLQPLAVSMTALYSIYSIYKNVTAKHKKPLVMTPRATRILFWSSFLAIAITAICSAGVSSWLGSPTDYTAMMALLGCLCGSHLLILAANYSLKPIESRINKHFYDAAAARLASMPDLKIIGVTGSYGKTSTKHYLFRILSEKYDVCMTPGSFNTTLGVVRTINEYLRPFQSVFIVEMGAKQRGDIKEICDLVHPSIGIVTAVGPQHLESFGTIENVADTKFELVDALPSNDSIAVINNDFEMIRKRDVRGPESTVRYSAGEDADSQYHATDIKYSSRGTSFTIIGPDGFCLPLTTRLVGECNISNLIAAVIVAVKLDVPADKIQYAVSHIEQVEHRLNIKATPGGLTIIDDAFNSNPVGSRMALDVLSMMEGGRRIVITPGMIELGEQQQELNREFGRHIAVTADLAMIVGQYNREAILEGIKDVLNDSDVTDKIAAGNVLTFDTFALAQHHLTTIARSGDTVLYENDLPDTFK
jgi:UDP-N-acetylmuramoyl-tripeptide--D-alanyl-D-alanine ligase